MRGLILEQKLTTTQQTYEEFHTLMNFLGIHKSNVLYTNNNPRWHIPGYTFELMEDQKVRINNRDFSFHSTLPMKDALEKIVNLSKQQEAR